ncbi:MAG: hypothetical protein J6Y98_06150 [Bacteroidales bacterium]|nr:hypothetical protein [Bacteroidales bacterium]
MKKTIILLFILTNTIICVFAQNKELKNEKDGFQWYKISANGFQGAESVDGNTIIPLSREYSSVQYTSVGKTKGYFSIKTISRKNETKEGACDIFGNEIIEPKYRAVNYLNKVGFIYVYDNDTIPFDIIIDSTGNALNGVVRKQSRVLRIEKDGFQWYRIFYNGYQAAESVDGTILIPPSREYRRIYYITVPGHEGYFAVDENHKEYEGACDKQGNIIFEPKYTGLYYNVTENTFKCLSIRNTDSSLFKALTTTNKSHNALTDTITGISMKERYLETASDGFKWYHLFENGYEGVEGIDGTTIIPISRKYKQIFFRPIENHKGYFLVSNNEDVGVCNIYGEEIIPPNKKYSDKIIFYSTVDDVFKYSEKESPKRGPTKNISLEIKLPIEYYGWEEPPTYKEEKKEEGYESVEFIYDYYYDVKTRETTYADSGNSGGTCSQYIVRFESKRYSSSIYIKIIALNGQTNEEKIIKKFTATIKESTLVTHLDYLSLKWNENGETVTCRTYFSYKNATELKYGSGKNRKHIVFGWDENNQALKDQCSNRTRTDNFKALDKMISNNYGWKKRKFKY